MAKKVGIKLLYMFTERRQAATVAAILVESDKVQDAKVVVYPGLFYLQIQLASDSPEDKAWLTGVMGAGQELGIPPYTVTHTKDALEIYNTKEGVKHFRGYSWSVYRKQGRRKRKLPKSPEK